MATKKTTKTAGKTKTSATGKATSPKMTVTEEAIRKKAEEIYFERIALGTPGTAEEDWAKAEQFFKKVD